MKKKLALLGTKDFSQQIIQFALLTDEYEIFGYFDDIEAAGSIIGQYVVKGDSDDAIRQYHSGLFDCIFICIGYTRFDLREKFYNKFKNVIPLATIISKNATIHQSVSIGEGVYIGGGNIIGAGCAIGDNVVAMGHSIFGHDNIVGKHTYFSGGNQLAGFTTIGERCFFGISSILSDHIRIGNDVWIGLGMIVYRNILKKGKYMVLQKIVKMD